jgi:TonB family protein
MAPRRVWLVLLLICTCGLQAAEDSKKPISRQGFLRAIEIGGLSNDELVSYIKELGVDFELQSQERQVLLSKGVEPTVLEALEGSYRMPLSSKEQEEVVAALSSGPPLTKEQLVGLLRLGTARPILQQVVIKRKAGFDVGPAERSEIEAAGGNPRLVATLAQNRYRPEPPPPPAPVVPVTSVPKPLAADLQAPKVTEPPPINQAAAILLDKKITPAEVLEKVQPMYPEIARRQRIGGTVRMELIVNEKGRVDSVRTISGHPFLVASAVSAAKQWRYTPASINGVPIKVTTILELVFKLN